MPVHQQDGLKKALHLVQQYKKWCISQSISDENIHTELNIYLKEGMYSSLMYCVWILTLRDLGIESDDDFNILAWWCQCSDCFPVLSKVVCDFLAIPSSGVGVEWLFNSAHDICHY